MQTSRFTAVSYQFDQAGPLASLFATASEVTGTGYTIKKVIPFQKDAVYSSYQARNAFGATADIMSEKGVAWAVSPQGLPGKQSQSSPEFRVPLAEAPSVKQQLVAVLTGDIGPEPVLEEFRDVHTATMDAKWETELSIHALRFRIAAVHLVRADTGEVVYRTNVGPDGETGSAGSTRVSPPNLSDSGGPSSQTAQPLQRQPVAIAGRPPADPTAQSYTQGRSDRQSWEQWFNGLTGDTRAGAEFWSAQRNAPHPGSCQGSAEFNEGCLSAQRRLAVSDKARKSDPQYWWGWNSL